MRRTMQPGSAGRGSMSLIRRRTEKPCYALPQSVESQADAYQQCLTAEFLMHLVPLLTGATDVDNVVAILATCIVQAAQQTLP